MLPYLMLSQNAHKNKTPGWCIIYFWVSFVIYSFVFKWCPHEMINMDNTHIYKGMSFLLLGYPPQIISWVLQILPPLKIISSSRFVRKGIHKDWFVFQLLLYNWFRKLEFHFFIVNRGLLGEHRSPATYYVGYKRWIS